MLEFDYQFISILFGLAGTFIILASNIFSYRNKVVKKEKFSLVSQMIGFLFLFNSFLYLLWPRISSAFVRTPAVVNFYYWPYYFFIGAGIIISLFLVKERSNHWGIDILISPETRFEMGIFLSPVVFAFLVMVLNSDFLLIVTIVAWFKFMEMLWFKN